MSTIFLLSPADCSGRRGSYLLNQNATFDVGLRLNSGQPVTIGEAFSFLSGLYFRGKLTYATRFAPAADPETVIYVITHERGLIPADTVVSRDDILAFRDAGIHPALPSYRDPLVRDARALALRHHARAVLLGSVATGKYVDILAEAFGERLHFPVDFAGRGDLSRGGLLLRAARSGVELEYAPVLTTNRHGPKPARLSKWG